MKYISLGNVCATAIILNELKMKTETYPFDWSPTSINTINDILINGIEDFINFDKPNIKGKNNKELIEFQKWCNVSRFINTYGCWFPHHEDKSYNELQEILQRRYKRFIDCIRGKEEITFVFSNENSIFSKFYREKEAEYIEELLKFSVIIKKNFNKENFKILCFFINTEEKLINDNIQIYNLEFKNELISDNFETCNPAITGEYRNLLAHKLEQVLK